MPPGQVSLNRREFLGSSAKNAAGVAAGVVFSGAVSAAQPGQAVRVGVIGVRSQGLLLAKELAANPQAELVALCDVDENILHAAAAGLDAPRSHPVRLVQDFRRLLDDRSIDAVCIATPDHWHALMTVAACQAGKDVYVEPPLTHKLQESAEVLAEVAQTQRIVQVGIQERSGGHFQTAVRLVQSGGLGAVHLAKAWAVHQRKPIPTSRETRVPEGVDYNLWLGPAPERAFQAHRFHHHWHWCWDYGSGELGNRGVHLLDVARWGLDVSLPQQVQATGGRFHFHDGQETPDTLTVTYAYPGKTILWEHRQWCPHPQEGRSAAVAFYGDKGTLIADRSGWKVYGQKDLPAVGASDMLSPHLTDFLDCVRTRRTPQCGAVVGHESSALCHLGNIAYRLGRPINLDPRSGAIQNDTDAVQLAGFDYRDPWRFDRVG